MEELIKELAICFFEWKSLPPNIEKQLEATIGDEIDTDPDLVEFQKRILQSTITSPIGVEFPPSGEKTRKLFKRLVLLLEERGVEVREEFYLTVAFVPSSSERPIFKSYFHNGQYLLSLSGKVRGEG